MVISVIVFFFKQKTAYEMRISDWSSDVCSSDLDFSPCLLQLLSPRAPSEAKMTEDETGGLGVAVATKCSRQLADCFPGVLGALARTPVFLALAPLPTSPRAFGCHR